MGAKICCKKSTSINDKTEIKNDDVTSKENKDDKNKIKVISPYFKQFALNSESTKVLINFKY